MQRTQIQERRGELKRMVDFTLKKYGQLCQSILDTGYKPMTVCTYLSERPSDEKICILRHDVDRKIINALRMAELEECAGIRSTYYFRYPYTFNPDLILNIASMGHEIGYHYETLAKARGDHRLAVRLFQEELTQFRAIAEIKTICMHGSPLSRYDNRDLWKVYDFREFEIAGEAYLSMAGNGLRYLTDTGRNWAGRHSLRDSMPDVDPAPVETTDDLIRWIGSAGADELYMTVHPERWAASDGEWIINSSKDVMINLGKNILKMVQ